MASNSLCAFEGSLKPRKGNLYFKRTCAFWKMSVVDVSKQTQIEINLSSRKCFADRNELLTQLRSSMNKIFFPCVNCAWGWENDAPSIKRANLRHKINRLLSQVRRLQSILRDIIKLNYSQWTQRFLPTFNANEGWKDYFFIDQNNIISFLSSNFLNSVHRVAWTISK